MHEAILPPVDQVIVPEVAIMTGKVFLRYPEIVVKSHLDVNW